MTTHDTLRTTAPTPDRRPNFPLRRGIALGVTALSLLGVWKGAELVADGISKADHYFTQNDFERNGCELTGETVLITDGKTLWDEAAKPLAAKMDVPVDEAEAIIEQANPSIHDAGHVPAGTVVEIPTCK